jgi:lipoprotein-anchoring transpeptidase ErfK/SrfK
MIEVAVAKCIDRRKVGVAAAVLVLAGCAVGQNAAARMPKASSRHVLVSIPDRKLAVMDGETVVATFPVAVGAAESPSPVGEFRIVSRVSNPTYYHPGTVIPSGKSNPVGTRWLGLNLKGYGIHGLKGYGIHGTNAPQSVGRAASHGCVRLRNRDVEQLFSMLHVGDAVEIRDVRDEQVGHIFGNGGEETVVAQAQASVPAMGQ